MAEDLILLVVVATALAFDFTNGFHDTGNATAASIATGALRPRVAVGLSAALNVVGAFLSLEVAKTIAGGIVDAGTITLTVVFAGLLGAITWNLLTWLLGLPSSSSHALIGGVVGATLAALGTSAVNGTAIVQKVLIPAVLAPVIAGGVAILGVRLAARLTRRASRERSERGFRLGQIASASMISLAHGTNDAQKTMGIITLALVAHGTIGADAGVPAWVVLSAALAIGAGTYMGGWRIIRTMGTRLTEITPVQGFSSDSAAATVILTSSHFGFPLSTTHVASGAIMGSGVGARGAQVRWRVAGRMAIAWIITLPAAGLVGAAMYGLAEGIGGNTGVVVVAALGAAMATGFWIVSRRDRVHAGNVTETAAPLTIEVVAAEGGEPAAEPAPAPTATAPRARADAPPEGRAMSGAGA
ncbi:inorganic phosphate transporter [Miltoncostaea marina]|uniref:inorganic phosphate transporter n=1 Tax=Miltoncostaea marina TaxID=2843215 RepID=UPI001C3D578C|nr:inorganic phosphate transporter [Miltoncostaea marina]